MSPFQPLQERARWRVIYDLLRATPINEVLTYEKIAGALDLHPNADRHLIQVAVRRAGHEFLTVDNHAITPVINVGYRVVLATEHIVLARGHQRRSSKALVRGHRAITHVDPRSLDIATRRAFEMVAHALTAQMDFSRRLDIRQSELGEALESIRQDHQNTQKRTDEEISLMRERLERLEQERLNRDP